MGRMINSAKTKVVFAPAVSNLAAPSRAEINAAFTLVTPGTTVGAGMQSMAGWNSATSNVSVPDVATTFDGQIPGRTSASEASITYYEDDASQTVRTAQAEGTAGVIIIMPYGDTAGLRCECFPAKVSGLNSSDVTSDANPATFTATYAITSAPNKNAVIPAA